MDNAPEPPSGGKSSQDRAPARAPARPGPSTARKPTTPRKGVAKNGGSKGSAGGAKKAPPAKKPSSASAASRASTTHDTVAEPALVAELVDAPPEVSPAPDASAPEEAAHDAPEEAEPDASEVAASEASAPEEAEPDAPEEPAPDAPEEPAPDTPEEAAPDAPATTPPVTAALDRAAASTRVALDRAGTATKVALDRAGVATTAAATASGAWLKRTADATRPRLARAADATREQLGLWRRAVAADVQEVREQWAEARDARAQRTAEREALVSGPAAEPRAELERAAPPADPATIELVVTPTRPAPGAPAPSGTALSVRGLVKRFGDTVAVDGVDLDVPVGCFYGIVGPNGAGKTTLLSMISGLLRPDAGTVLVHDADVWRDPVATKRDMGVLPDRLRLFDRLTGSQLLYYSAMLRGLNRPTARRRTADLASVFGIEDALGRLVTDYSTGMTKKVALAAAMIHAPRLLVLDEPFESVDPVSAATVTEILRKYALAGGTVVLSSHSMDLVQRMCDRVAVIVEGSIIAEGTVAEVRGAATLQERFVELAGRKSVEELEWLHGSSS